MKTTLLSFLLLTIAVVGYSQRTAIVEEGRTISTENTVIPFSFPKSVKKERYKVAVLTPLYLDSVNLATNVSHIPKFMMPGIDFYQGVMIAADTLKNSNYKMDLYIYDSKSNYLDVKNLIESDKLDSMDLIIGNASVSDLKLLADFAKKNLINFISAVSPSDADQEFNPYFTILQPRLASHIEKMHQQINYRAKEDNVIFAYRNTTSEKNALAYFKDDVLNSLPGRFSDLLIKNNEITEDQIKERIDSNYNISIVLGVLDPAVTYNILKNIDPLGKKYRIKVYCMPTTEAITALSKTNEFPNITVFYTTSYIIDQITPASMYITREYKKKMGTTPSDVVYKGFESLFFFSNLMNKYGVPFNAKISDNSYSFITPYKIVPVKEKGSIKFFENKFLYLIRYDNGIMTYE